MTLYTVRLFLYLSIKKRTIQGAKWSIIDNAANTGITFLVGLVLARLLSPEQFGIIGIATIFINLFNTIAIGGLDIALIRKNDCNDTDFNTTFYSNLTLALILIAILCLCASPLSIFFNEPQLATLLPTMSIILLINAAASIQRTILTKQLDFKTQAIISLYASTISGIIAIAMALNDFGVWSLVAQQIIRQTIISLLLWIKGTWKPAFAFSTTAFKDLFGFSWKVLAANIVNSLFRDAFLAVIGKVHTSQSLGYYNRADQFKSIFTNNLSQIVQKVSMPAMSEIQDDKQKLQLAFRKIVNYTALVSFSFGLIMIAVAKPMILLLIGEKWLPAVKYLQIMCTYAIIAPVTILNANLLNLFKRSDLYLKIELIKKLLFALVILAGVFFSIETMLWCAVGYYYIDYFITSFYSFRLIGYGVKAQMTDILPILLISFIISALIWSITLIELPHIATLIIQLSLAAGLYHIAFRIIKKTEVTELKEIIINEVKKTFSK